MWKRLLLSCLLCTAPALAEPAPFNELLARGKVAEARTLVEQLLADHPEGRDDLKLELALVQLLGSVEKFSQTMYRYGLRSNGLGELIPFLRFPVAENLTPEAVTHEKMRAALVELLTGLDQCAHTLSTIPDDSDVRLPFRIGKVKLDLDGNGLIGSREEFWRVFQELNRNAGIDEKLGSKLGAHLDVGDVRWLEGYCHLLGALGEIILAYDTGELFEHTAHLFFLHPQTRYPYLQDRGDSLDWQMITDIAAFVHLLNFPVKEPARLQTALNHLQQVTALSRRSWKAILAETDDEFEWIPNPRQKGVLPNGRVNQEMVDAWLAFLDEADSILAGQTLLPFWRTIPPGQGLNARRMFTDPAPLDAVLWLQGPGAARYLEAGKVTDPSFWQMLGRVFRGDFLGYALWFN